MREIGAVNEVFVHQVLATNMEAISNHMSNAAMKSNQTLPATMINTVQPIFAMHPIRALRMMRCGLNMVLVISLLATLAKLDENLYDSVCVFPV